MAYCSGCDNTHDSYLCPYRGLVGEQKTVYPASLPPGFDEWIATLDTED